MTDTLAAARQRIAADTLADEDDLIRRLINIADLADEQRRTISASAAELVREVRDSSDPSMMESFLGEYGLSTQEGVALMCLAEALLRVPDNATIDDLIADKITPHDWGAHVGDSGSILVNASTWALMFTGKVLADEPPGVVGALRGVVRRLGEPVVRIAVRRAMQEMGEQFVLGETIGSAVGRGDALVEKGYTYSYDMLGEAARTHDDAKRYFEAYADAIAALAERARSDSVAANPGISVKLSALHPRYETLQQTATIDLLCERVLTLARAAAAAGLGFNIDAEEANRLEFSLDVIERVLADESLASWDGFGVVVQAYGRRAIAVIDWLQILARQLGRRIMVRLVKGAYWDTEIKEAQVLGLDSYPVLTRKINTDVSYIACARRLLAMRERIYPQFATHNAHTMAAVLELAGDRLDDFEFQRLHGMGEALHEAFASGLVRAAAFMRQSGHTKICSPTSSGGCSRTAQTRVSSIRSSTRASHRKPLRPIHCSKWPNEPRRSIATYRRHACYTVPAGPTRRVTMPTIRQRLRRWMQRVRRLSHRTNGTSRTSRKLVL